VQNTDYYLTVDGSNISPGTGSTIGVYTVQNNKVTDYPPTAIVLETAPVVGPNTVTGNVDPGNVSDNLVTQSGNSAAPTSTPTSTPTPNSPSPTPTPNSPSPTPTVQTWTENWNDLSNWDPMGSTGWTPQSGSLRTVQQSAGLLSNKRWDSSQTLKLSCNVQSRPGPGSTSTSFWAGLTLTTLDTSANFYVEIEEIGNYPPGPDASNGIQSSDTFVGGAQDKVMVAYTPWAVHNLQISWNPATRTFDYLVDGVVRQSITNNSVSGSLLVELVVTSVLPATPNDGSSCEALFGPLVVQGAPA
ncbi:MAG TPA: hypothetical protein VK457_09710, partial [Chloroflexota bacterium]|nr:hypothetical protein [Chloroflexota bacterium]